jgi:hypothetical protein
MGRSTPFFEFLESLRAAKGVSQSAWVKQINTSLMTYRGWQISQPRVTSIQRVAEALELPPTELFAKIANGES